MKPIKDEESDMIKLKYHFQPKREKARKIYLSGLGIGIVGFILMIVHWLLSTIIVVSGFLTMVYGSFLKKQIEKDIANVGYQLSENRKRKASEQETAGKKFSRQF